MIRRDRLASWATTALLAAAFVLFVAVVRTHYPVAEWLVVRYLAYFFASACFSVACLGLGHVTVRAVLQRRPVLPLLEHTLVAYCLGVLLYEIVVFFVGLAQGYGTVFFFALPAALIAATLRPLLRTYVPALRTLRRHARMRRARPLWQLAVMAAGTLGLVMVYLAVMSPENVEFDARWKHLPLAEDFIAAGGVRRFDEGWIFATRAHFTSYLYTWAFAVPTHRLFDQVELSQHLEFTIFLWTTLLGVPVLVRRLVPRADPGLVWAARFLFPGILLYDSGLHGGADHIVAAFVVPAYLLTRRALRRFDSGLLVLLGAVIAALVMGKETVSIMVVPGVAAALGIRWLQAAVQQVRGRAPRALAAALWRAPLVFAAACALFSAPHWLCNWLWYGDPFYPVLYKYFASRPWVAESAYDYEHAYVEYQMWRPPRTFEGVVQTLKALATFSFVPNDFPKFHGTVPVFGSLLTLLLPTALLMRRTGAIWALALWTHVGVFTWYWVHHQDRYLQGLLPWMAALVAALLIRLWRSGSTPVRVATVALVVLQVCWGLDVYFIPGHPTLRTPVEAIAKLVARGYKKDYAGRLETQPVFSRIGASLPRGAHPLLHENHAHLGLAHTSVSDWSTWQYGIDYAAMRSARDVYDLLARMRVTHLVWTSRSRAWDSLASDLRFYDFASHHTEGRKVVAGHHVARMPARAPSVDATRDIVALLGCGRAEHAGLYHVADLRTPSFGPRMHVYPTPFRKAQKRDGKGDADALLAEADFAVVEARCHANLTARLARDFEKLAVRGRVPRQRLPEYTLWSRRKGATSAPSLLDALPDDPDEPGDDDSPE